MRIDCFDILPYEGVGPLRFGFSRDNVHTILGYTFSKFRKGPFAVSDTDAYDELCLHLYYDLQDRLECVEAFGSCPICYNKVVLLHRDIESVVSDLAKSGLTCRFDDGYFFDDGGFALVVDESTVEAITVYRRGYYDE